MAESGCCCKKEKSSREKKSEKTRLNPPIDNAHWLSYYINMKTIKAEELKPLTRADELLRDILKSPTPKEVKAEHVYSEDLGDRIKDAIEAEQYE